MPEGVDAQLAYIRWVMDITAYQFSGPVGSDANPYWFPVRRELFPDV